MEGNYIYISVSDLICKFKKHSPTNQDIDGYDLYLFLKSSGEQNYIFKGHFSLPSNIYEDDVFEVDCKNGTELRLFAKQNDKENSLNSFLEQIDRQSILKPMSSMETLESLGFVRFDGKIRNGKLDSLVCGQESIKFYKQYADISNNKTKKQAGDDLLSEIEKQNNAEKIDYKSTSMGHKIKIAKDQIQKENKPMLVNDLTNHKNQ